MGTDIVVSEIFRDGMLLEDAVLHRSGGSFNSHGEWVARHAPVAVRVITTPVPGDERETEAGGGAE